MYVDNACHLFMTMNLTGLKGMSHYTCKCIGATVGKFRSYVLKKRGILSFDHDDGLKLKPFQSGILASKTLHALTHTMNLRSNSMSTRHENLRSSSMSTVNLSSASVLGIYGIEQTSQQIFPVT